MDEIYERIDSLGLSEEAVLFRYDQETYDGYIDWLYFNAK